MYNCIISNKMCILILKYLIVNNRFIIGAFSKS